MKLPSLKEPSTFQDASTETGAGGTCFRHELVNSCAKSFLNRGRGSPAASGEFPFEGGHGFEDFPIRGRMTQDWLVWVIYLMNIS